MNDRQGRSGVRARAVRCRPQRPSAGRSLWRLGLSVVSATVVSFWPWVAAGQAGPESDSASAAGKYVARVIERQRIEARSRLLAEEVERLQRSPALTVAGEDLHRRLVAAGPAARQAAATVLAQAAGPVGSGLQQGIEELDREISETAAAWTRVRTALCDGQSLLAGTGGGQRPRWMVLMSLDDRWFWASVFVSLGALAGVALHANRHAVRRRLSGRVGRALTRWSPVAGFLLLASVVAGLGLADRWADATAASDAADRDLPRRKMEADAALFEAEAERLSGLVQIAAKARSEFKAASVRNAAAAAGDLSAVAPGFRDRVLELEERLAVLESLPRAIRADLADLGRVEEQWRAASEAAARDRFWQRGIRAAVGLTTLGAVLVGAWGLRRAARLRGAAVANTCPLCLGEIHAAPASQNGHAAGSTAVRCQNLLDQVKGVRCNYAIRDAYRAMPKLFFPTLGVPRAGKTHWAAMAYWQLNRGNHPPAVRFERVRPIEVASGEDFDRIVEQILISRLGTTGTQGARIPHPMVFNFRDRDRWGLSSVLVNLFDYSGEVTATLGVDDYRRRRALEADGYLFFLDPTLPSEPQAKALAEFREDLRLVKGVDSHRKLRLPLALCVSKIDLLAGQSYASPDGGDPVAAFYDGLARIDPTGEAMTLEVFEARSRLVARLRDTIWPGWQIERSVEELFGGRALYFPLTPVGLDGRGEKDLSLRTIAPFGLLEPLLWLLHMNGYPVLG